MFVSRDLSMWLDHVLLEFLKIFCHLTLELIPLPISHCGGLRYFIKKNVKAKQRQKCGVHGTRTADLSLPKRALLSPQPWGFSDEIGQKSVYKLVIVIPSEFSPEYFSYANNLFARINHALLTLIILFISFSFWLNVQFAYALIFTPVCTCAVS